MHDRGKVIAGIVIFLLLVLFPIWYTGAFGDFTPPDLDAKAKGENCVRDPEWMRAHHMELLDEWRNDVVRNADRGPVVIDGVEWEKSLIRTCLNCHQSYESFCSKCHSYADVEPTCWNCHIIPEGS